MQNKMLFPGREMTHFKHAVLAPVTKAKYNRAIEKWIGLGLSLKEIIENPPRAMKALKAAASLEKPNKITDSVHTRHTFYSAIVAYIHHEMTPVQRSRYYNTWRDLMLANEKPLKEHYLEQKPTALQEETVLKWKDVLEKRDALPAGMPKLLLAFYSYIPPVRSDYLSTRLLQPEDPIPKGENYIVLGTEYRLVIQQHKTKHTYDTIEHTLPPRLKELLQESLKEQPREFLFTTGNGAGMSKAYYGTWSGRILSKIFGHRTNVMALRHAYANTINYNAPIKDLSKITSAMGHSVERSMRYRWLEGEGDKNEVVMLK